MRFWKNQQERKLKTKTSKKKVKKKKGKETDAAVNDDAIIYKVQFMTAPRDIPAGDRRLRGLDDVESYTDGGVVKLTVGSHTSLTEAQKHLGKVKKLFPDAFIIKTRGGKRIR